MLRDVYARKGLSQIPRLLSLEDRNPFSPTFGCCNREYWLCRSTDFPSSIAQFGLHALALAWRYEMPGNIYYRKDKVRDWLVAGMLTGALQVEQWPRLPARAASATTRWPLGQ